MMKFIRNNKKDKNEKVDFNNPKDWFYDRYLARTVEANRYLMAFIVTSVLLALTLVTFLFLMPLKNTIMEPYVILVDNISGVTATLTAVKTADLQDHTPVVRYFLAKYVEAREGYSAATVNEYIERVQAFSTPDVFTAFQNSWNDPAHQEALKLLGTQGKTDIEILSVTFPLPDIAHIRFVRKDQQAGVVVQSSTWLATLKIEQMKEIDDTLVVANPLGIVVTHYQLIKEGNNALH
jgi:type IV secretion system protein VirB8